MPDSIQRLKMSGLPVMQTLDDFSYVTHISASTIYQLSEFSVKYYKTFIIPKKSGQERLIAQPTRKLKGLQAWILVNILGRLQVSDSSKGFEIGSSIVDNAKPHIGANIVVSLDLADFFPTVPKKRVFNVFRSAGYNNLISTVLTNLCSFNGGLPQGAPTSPKLANLVLWRLDSRIQGYVGKRGITYTRYADDLTFSGTYPNKVCKIVPTLRKIIEDEGFLLNENKTRIAGSSRAKKVTGLVVTNTSVGIGKRVYKILRAKIHSLSKLDNSGSLEYPETRKLLFHIIGWLSYLNSVDPVRYRRTQQYIKKLVELYPTSLVAALNPHSS